MSLATNAYWSARSRTRLLTVLTLALPAFLLTNESFQPIEEAISLDGRDASHVFSLDSVEPLLLELEFIIRSPEQGVAETNPAAIVVALNDSTIARLVAQQLYVVNRAMPLAQVNTVRKGENQLDIKLEAPPSFTFDVTMRIHNYRGISPRFPRVFVVPDEAVWQFFSEGSRTRHLLRLGIIGLLSLLVILTVALLARRQSDNRSTLLLLAPSTLLWTTALYSLATSLHIWLSIGALLVLILVPCLLMAGVLWIHTRRRTVALVTAVTVVALVVCETGLRLLNLVAPNPIFYTDSYSRYRGRPGTPFLDSRLNSMGFNDVEHTLTQPTDVHYRIAAIGDSTTFGVVPYTANYLTLLETALAEDGPVEIINMGVPGTEPSDYLSILVAEGLAFEPDLVMVGFFIGNDFESTRRQPYERSYLATATYFVWTLLTAGATPQTLFQASGPTYTDDAPTFTPERFLEIEVDRASIYLNGDTDFNEAVAEALGYLRQIRNISARANIEILVILIPDEAQVNDELADLVTEAYGAIGSSLDFERPNKLLVEALISEGIPYLDLLPAFIEEGQHTQLYKPRDTHWNLAGNRLATETIAPVVREHIRGSR
jgi:lysophospholipase L1-like esterase